MTATPRDTGTAAGLLNFLDSQMSYGNINRDTGNAQKTAVRDVLSNTFEDWEHVDPLSIDVPDTLRRWETLRKTAYSPGSLTTYKTRFRRAVEEYGKWHDNPSGYKPDSKPRVRKATAPAGTNGALKLKQTEAVETLTQSTFGSHLAVPKAMNVITYPFPLRPGVLASLDLPSDMTKREAKRLCAFIDSLADDEQPAIGPAQGAVPATEA